MTAMFALTALVGLASGFAQRFRDRAGVANCIAKSLPTAVQGQIPLSTIIS